jgi:Tol biopolymer transport system component
MYEFASGALTRLSPDGQDSAPVWSPDGRHITYTTRRNGERQILTQTLDASAPPMMLVSSRNDLWPAVWTPDGSRLLYVEDPPTSLADIKAIRRAANSQPETVTSGPPSETQPDLSPDGQWLVFARFDGPRPQIFVRPLAGGTPRQITPEEGGQPRWSRDGREIFFRRLGKIMRIPVQTTPALVVGKPETLFDDPYVSGYRSRNYDVSADGRFLMVKLADTEKMAQPIHIITGWIEELKRRVPTRP